MSKPNKKKSSKSVSIPKKGKSKGNDNFDAKYEEALRIKKINILAEFEKHKKELFFEVQDTSKVSEAKVNFPYNFLT